MFYERPLNFREVYLILSAILVNYPVDVHDVIVIMQIYEIGANIGANIFILIYKVLFINILSITILYLSRRRSRVRVPSIPPQILVKVPAKRGLFSRPYFTPPVFNRKNSVTGGGETFHLHHIPHRDTVRSTRIRQPEQSPDVCFHPDENRKHRLLYKSCNDRKYSIWCSNLPITFHIVSKLFIKNESRIFISVKVRSF